MTCPRVGRYCDSPPDTFRMRDARITISVESLTRIRCGKIALRRMVKQKSSGIYEIFYFDGAEAT
jgi:hypothetical protein